MPALVFFEFLGVYSKLEEAAEGDCDPSCGENQYCAKECTCGWQEGCEKWCDDPVWRNYPCCWDYDAAEASCECDEGLGFRDSLMIRNFRVGCPRKRFLSIKSH